MNNPNNKEAPAVAKFKTEVDSNISKLLDAYKDILRGAQIEGGPMAKQLEESVAATSIVSLSCNMCICI